MRRKAFLVILFLCSIFCLNAQEETDEWFMGKNISSIEFTGLKNVKKSDLAAITDAYVDVDFTLEIYEELLDRIYALDLFEDFESFANHDPKDENSVVLVLNVVEHPVVSMIVFSGNQKIRNGELRDVIKTKNSDIYTQSKILVDERLIRDHYIAKGYTDSTVTHKIEQTENGVTVTFQIKEGANTVIKKISMQGNSVFSERSLKGKLALKEAGLLKDGAFQNASLEQDKRTIISLYQEKGYADASILDVKIENEFNEEKQRVELTITFIIQEGPQYIFKGITLSGNEVFTEKELLANLKLKEGDIFNAIKFQEGLMGIQSVYVDNGYMTCQMYPVPSKNLETKEISYKLSIVESTRSHIENVIIKGNSKTKDFVIRREIPIETGDIFSREKLFSGARNLYSLQYFSNIIPDVQSGSEQGLVDVIYSVEEQSTIALNFGMTFSGVSDPNDLPISLYTKFENSNMFGEGKGLSLQVTLAKNEQSIDFSYAQNWLFNKPISYSQSLQFSHTKSYTQELAFFPVGYLDPRIYMSYEGYTASLGTSFGRRWYPDFAILTASGGLTNSLARYVYDEANHTPLDPVISNFANRWGVTNSLWGSLSVDARDISFNPSNGWFFNQRLSWYGLIPGLEKEFFLRTDSKLEGYLTAFNIPVSETWSFKGVLAGYLGVSALFPVSGSSVSDSNRLYVDGMFNGRGWTELYKSTGKKGQLMLSNKIELRIPIVPNIVGIDLFHDIVAIKPQFSDMFTSLSLNDFYFSFGPSIRILMQQLPLHFLFAFRYQHDDNGFRWADNPYQFLLSFSIMNK